MQRSRFVFAVCISVMTLSSCGLGWLLEPKTKFDESPTVKAPDYNKAEAWAVTPEAPGKSGFLPEKVKAYPLTDSHRADVFFVHPTAWFSREQWNADFLPGPSREVVDEISMATQASVFNGCCRIFAPRYRQATLGSFYAPVEQAEPAFEIAYKDIERAFDAFLEKRGKQPFFIAGHSQGSMHLMRLLTTRVQNNAELKQRMVAAYLPGVAIPMSWYEQTGLSACTTPEQTGCIAAWDTYQEKADVKGHEPVYHWNKQKLVRHPIDAPRQCTNPISWQTQSAPTPRALHLGAVPMVNTGKPFSFSQLIFSNAPLNVKITGLEAPRKKLTTAYCDGKALRVTDLKAQGYPVMETQAGNYHLLDYELFWMNIRHNTFKRLAAWWKL